MSLLYVCACVCAAERCSLVFQALDAFEQRDLSPCGGEQGVRVLGRRGDCVFERGTLQAGTLHKSAAVDSGNCQNRISIWAVRNGIGTDARKILQGPKAYPGASFESNFGENWPASRRGIPEKVCDIQFLHDSERRARRRRRPAAGICSLGLSSATRHARTFRGVAVVATRGRRGRRVGAPARPRAPRRTEGALRGAEAEGLLEHRTNCLYSPERPGERPLRCLQGGRPRGAGGHQMAARRAQRRLYCHQSLP